MKKLKFWLGEGEANNAEVMAALQFTDRPGGWGKGFDNEKLGAIRGQEIQYAKDYFKFFRELPALKFSDLNCMRSYLY